MVSRIREVKTEEDRYGGYGRGGLDNIRSFERAKDFLFTEEVISKTEVPSQDLASQDGSPIFSKRVDFSSIVPRKEEELRRYPTRQNVVGQYSVKKESHDLMPSIKTQAYAKSIKNEQDVYAESNMAKTRFRVMAAIYIIAVLVISALVIGIAVAISSTTGSVVDPYSYEAVSSVIQVFNGQNTLNITEIFINLI
ncbi:MAG: hypothetical protein FWE22_01025 [Firmicutes bacterium]|nr:hypothetical protein [Bacillota bacterium]